MLKTPLRYPGGKSRAVKKMEPFLPDIKTYSRYREPFLGGGSLALWVSQTYPRLPIWVNDIYFPVYNFWTYLQTDSEDMSSDLSDLKNENLSEDDARALFTTAKAMLSDPDVSDYDKAVYFYIVNKCSFSGLTESSSFSAQASVSNFGWRGIHKLSEYSSVIEHWEITNLSYEDMLGDAAGMKELIYLDPPYEIGKNYLYGKKGSTHKGFDHEAFANNCRDSKQDILVSYNTSSDILYRFNGWGASTYDLTYTMRSTGGYMEEQADRKELLLWNYEKVA